MESCREERHTIERMPGAVQIKQLRILSTVLLAFALAQAGLGSGYLDVSAAPGETSALLIAHATNAFAVLVLSILSAVFGMNFRRSNGPQWSFFLPLAIVIVAGIQITLGFAAVRGGHVFTGVLLLCLVTVFCSYTWRHRTTADRTLAGSAADAQDQL